MNALTVESMLGPMQRVTTSVGDLEYHERGTGRPLVFVHGLALHAGFWRKVVPALAETHRCIVPTWPLGGHRQALQADADLTPPGIARLIHEVLERLGLEDAVIVGNDTGGAFVQILATQHPERVGALVLTPSDAFDNFLPLQVRYLQYLAHVPGAVWQVAQTLRSATVRRSVLGYGPLTKHGIEDAVTASYIAPLLSDARVRRDTAKVLRGIHTRYTLEAAQRLPNFERPALIAWATEDRLFPRAHAERLAALLPQARLEWIEDSRTYVVEDNPDRFLTVLRRFLETSRSLHRAA